MGNDITPTLAVVADPRYGNPCKEKMMSDLNLLIIARDTKDSFSTQQRKLMPCSFYERIAFENCNVQQCIKNESSICSGEEK